MAKFIRSLYGVYRSCHFQCALYYDFFILRNKEAVDSRVPKKIKKNSFTFKTAGQELIRWNVKTFYVALFARSLYEVNQSFLFISLNILPKHSFSKNMYQANTYYCGVFPVNIECISHFFLAFLSLNVNR